MILLDDHYEEYYMDQAALIASALAFGFMCVLCGSIVAAFYAASWIAETIIDWERSL